MPEFRTPVMTWVEASWQDSSGVLQTVPARMEDKSSGGACIRINTPIGVGAKLKVQWRFEQFSGTARYCRTTGKDYLVGIQRDVTNRPIPNQSVLKDVPPPQGVSRNASAAPVQTQSLPKRQESQPKETPAAMRQIESARIAPTASFAAAAPQPGIGGETDHDASPRVSRLQEFDALRRAHLRTKHLPRGKESGKERKHMPRKWLELPWRNKRDGLSVSPAGGGTGEARDHEDSIGDSGKENLMPHVTQIAPKAPVHSAREVPEFQVELLPMEDICRTAGIMIPRKGYSIKKVVEMLNSQYIRGLSKEMKRVALLMALDAAGVPIDEVLQDAKSRRNALDAYEAQQRKQVEAEWARKADEITQIQAELESIKAHYMARISRTQEGVARQKATFDSWVTLKQQECQSMAEAAELCVKLPVSEPASPPPQVSLVKAAAAAGGAASAKEESQGDAIR